MSFITEDNTSPEKSYRLDPVGVICRFAQISFMEIGTILSIHHNQCLTPVVNTRRMTSPEETLRFLRICKEPIIQCMEWYEKIQGGYSKLPEMDYILKRAICGLEHYHEMYGRNPALDSMIVSLQGIIQTSLHSTAYSSEFILTRTPEFSSIRGSSLPIDDNFQLESSSSSSSSVDIQYWTPAEIRRVYSVCMSLSMSLESGENETHWKELDDILNEQDRKWSSGHLPNRRSRD
jgi:hypothetical protein